MPLSARAASRPSGLAGGRHTDRHTCRHTADASADRRHVRGSTQFLLPPIFYVLSVCARFRKYKGGVTVVFRFIYNKNLQLYKNKLYICTHNKNSKYKQLKKKQKHENSYHR